MPVTVGVNNMSVVHAGSNGITIAFPDVCKTPAPPAPFVPIPYPNIAKAADSSKTAKKVSNKGDAICVKDSNFMMSTGDEAGTLLGIVSSKIKGKAEFINFSFVVKTEGKNGPRARDPMPHNDKNPPPFPLVQPPLPVIAMAGDAKAVCACCGDEFELET